MGVIAILLQQNRIGRHISSVHSVPLSAKGVCKIQADISTSNPNHLQDNTKSLTFTIEVYDGVAWRFFAGLTWSGGVFPPVPWGDPNGMDQPGLAFDVVEVAGKQVRVILDIPTQIKIGAKVTL